MCYYLNQDKRGMIPGITCILVPLRLMTARPSKTGRGLNHKPQSTGKVENTEIVPLGAS